MKEIFGYRFCDETLLERALTTPAYRMEQPNAQDNQRLEFLGDAVLNLLAADQLYADYHCEEEGGLTVKRTHMVSSVALCEVAAREGLAARLRRNHAATDLPKNSKTLADAVEAVLGAAWIDGGLDAARTVYAQLKLAAESPVCPNPKGDLQVKVQAMRPPRHPSYELLKVDGPAHRPRFTVRVLVDGVGEATGEAGSRREAESIAARRLLASLSV